MLPPQYSYVGPLTRGPITCQPPYTTTWRHSGVRVDSHGPATCRSHLYARVRVALPRGLVCHVASARIPRATSAPWVLWRYWTPFCLFFKGIKIKINSRKIKKSPKNSEIYTFKNITPFKRKFSPLAQKFISFEYHAI